MQAGLVARCLERRNLDDVSQHGRPIDASLVAHAETVELSSRSVLVLQPGSRPAAMICTRPEFLLVGRRGEESSRSQGC